MQESRSLVRACAARLEAEGRLSQLRRYAQHGRCSVYEHSVEVAVLALELSRRLRLKTDESALIRGALLHDYFLYDWHVPDPQRPLHGFYHPKAALENARQDFALSRKEEDIIRRHMFPLTPVPPATAEGLLVCLADKLCAIRETLFRR